MHWEYKLVYFTGAEGHPLDALLAVRADCEAALNKIGQDGWAFATLLYQGSPSILLFQRQRPALSAREPSV